MKRFQNILLVVDAHDVDSTTVDCAAAIARRNGARLTLAAAVEEIPRWMRIVIPETIEFAHEQLLSDLKQRMDGVVGRLEWDGEVATYVLTGRPWEKISQLVVDAQIDLVVKAPDPQVRRHRDVLLLRNCPSAVWIVKNDPLQFRRVAAAVHLEPDDPDRDPLNQKIMELASSVAQLNTSELHAICAWRMFGESIERFHIHSQEHETDLDRAKVRQQEHRESLVEEFIAPFRDEHPGIRSLLVEGEPDDVITRLAESESEDLIVMGTVARSGWRGLIVGNLVEKLLDRLPCSLLAVKPDDFESPLHGA